MGDNIQSERLARVRLEILIALDRVSGYMLAENILFADTNLHLSPTASLSEFRSELSVLEQKGLIVIVSDSLGGHRKVRITDGGRAELATRQ